MSVLRETNEQILVGVRHRWRSDAEQRRAAVPVQLIDELIADLEELHLTDRKRVPPSYQERLIQLTAVLAPEMRQELRSRVTIVHLMEQLYTIQGLLLARRAFTRGHDGGTRPQPLLEPIGSVRSGVRSHHRLGHPAGSTQRLGGHQPRWRGGRSEGS